MVVRPPALRRMCHWGRRPSHGTCLHRKMAFTLQFSDSAEEQSVQGAFQELVRPYRPLCVTANRMCRRTHSAPLARGSSISSLLQSPPASEPYWIRSKTGSNIESPGDLGMERVGAKTAQASRRPLFCCKKGRFWGHAKVGIMNIPLGSVTAEPVLRALPPGVKRSLECLSGWDR